MGRMNAMHKPGEKVYRAGRYYCYVCSLRGETETCDPREGELFLACPKCLERKVPEWDMVWKQEDLRPGGKRWFQGLPWPGSLSRPA